MTEKLYLADSYTKEFYATVTSVRENCVALDRTLFYPGGGGVPYDEGILISEERAYRVLLAKYIDGEIYHCLDVAPPLGSQVRGVIDWEKRYRCMRFHTALHVLSAVAHNKYHAEVTGNQIHVDKARIDFDLEGAGSEIAREIERETNRIVREERPIIVRTITREEALKIPDLMRTKTGRMLLERLKEVRVVEIQALDAQADGGPHVANTGEIVGIKIVKTESKGKRNRRLELVLEQ